MHTSVCDRTHICVPTVHTSVRDSTHICVQTELNTVAEIRLLRSVANSLAAR